MISIPRSFVPVLLLGFASAQGVAGAVEDKAVYDDLGLSLSFEALGAIQGKSIEKGQLRGRWTGKVGNSSIDVSLRCYPRAAWNLHDSDDVLDLLKFNERKRSPFFKLEERRHLKGPFGAFDFATFATSANKKGTATVGASFYLGGVLEEFSYSLVVRAAPEPKGASRAAIMKFFEKGVVASCKKDDVRWAKQEVVARWKRDTPSKIHKKLKVLRTKHYIIFTNSAGGKLFGKKMELFYKKIRELYPFPEVEGRKLMPVFLFRERSEYIDFYAKVAKTSRSAAARSKGHAWKDYYATYYEAPNDPVHIHEATHQIFSNRLRLGGGGSWFQEGVAEYIERLYRGFNEIKTYAKRAARKKTYTPFARFAVVPSLLQSSGGTTKRGENLAHNAYAQAASIIAFLHKSKFGKKKFQEFLHAVGKVARGDLKGINRSIRKVYGTDLNGLEKEWRKYWAKK